jgi:ATP-dependent helicase/nuclease subunit B
MAVAGRIDRIDRIGEGCYRVVDYKTGSYSLFEDLVDFGKGRILQHALYAIAGEQVLKKLKIDALPVVTESGYYFPTRKGEGNKIMREVKRRAFKDLVAEIITILENGHFVANPGLGDAECEDFCDYAPVCGGAAAKERAKRKKEQNQEVFGIFERLKDYD